jgi:hypothetical protein
VPTEAPHGDALWAYYVARAGTGEPEGAVAVDDAHPVERVEAGRLTAFVSRVPLSEFGEEPLRRNLNDFPWLERIARRHEAVLEAGIASATVVPLRMCTIFADEESVARMLEEQQAAFSGALDALDGREEWAVKVLVDRPTLEAAARATDPALAPQAGVAEGSGAAYFGQRRVERQLRETAERIAADLAEDVHLRVSARAVGAVVNRPQNRRLSGHEGDMVLNGAYLVDRDRAGELPALVAELRSRHERLGARVELSGPLPPFNFAVPA